MIADMKMPLSDNALSVVELLERAGFEVYIVGGCVRDWLLRRHVHDIDIATDASCASMTELFKSAGKAVYDTGSKHNTLTVVSKGEPFEISSYRAGANAGNDAPQLKDDLARRDFTMNALAYNPSTGLVDPFGGASDIFDRTIRCVGRPADRFDEDGLRIMRALRFSSQLSFAIEETTLDAMRKQKSLLAHIAPERIANELCLFVCGADVRRVLCDYVDILGVVIPELVALKGFDQHNRYHIYTTLEHTAVAMERIAPVPVLRMTALLHDIGKPEVYTEDEYGRGRCLGHPQAGARIARDVLTRLRISRDFTRRVVTLIEHHEDNLQATRANVLHHLHELGPETLRYLLALKRADVGALSPAAHEWLPLFDDVEYLMDELLSQDACFRIDQLAISGGDVIAAGVPAGPQVKRTLEDCLTAVIEGRTENTRTALLSHLAETT